MDYQAYDRMPRWKEYLALGLPVGSIFGIRVRIHVLMIIPLLFIWSSLAGGSDPLPIRLALWAIVVTALYASVLAHELGHCYGAKRVGGHASQIILWPLGGLAILTGAEKGPKQELIVTLLGPAVSLALALVFTIAYYIVPQSGWLGFVSDATFILMWVNWMLTIFNMAVPLFPMDCARIVRSLFSFRYNPNKVTLWLTTGGVWLGGAIAVVGLALFIFVDPGFWNIGLIGLFCAVISHQERQRCQVMDVYVDGPWYWRDASYRSETAPAPAPVWKTAKAGAATIIRDLKARNRAPKRKARIVDLSNAKERRKDLRAKLEEAILYEDFERAARLRDEIQNLGE